MLTLSLGIMAYNEEANIADLLDAVLRQRFSNYLLKEILVVVSGSTDRTEEIVNSYIAKDNRIRLLVQQEREGKASAVNLFLSKADADILILESADTIPQEDTLNKLVEPFTDSKIGMTGARPVPVNSKDTFIGFTVQLMWDLHHKIALISPKLGELVAFRNFVREIPQDTPVDEASIEAIVRNSSYKLRYVPEAIVRNKGPENIMDFIKQRRRITAGHKQLSKKQEYNVSTANPLRILGILVKGLSWKPKEIIWTMGAIGLEFIGRVLGYYDWFIKKHNPAIWDIALSTKSGINYD